MSIYDSSQFNLIILETKQKMLCHGLIINRQNHISVKRTFRNHTQVVIKRGENRLVQVRIGQVRLGQVRLGQVRLGKVRLRSTLQITKSILAPRDSSKLFIQLSEYKIGHFSNRLILFLSPFFNPLKLYGAWGGGRPIWCIFGSFFDRITY